jgi:DNA-binding transcriptional LysR family regulator
MNVTLRQLKIFEAVSRHLSFTRAAEELFLTQPAVSMQVKQLEGQTGLPLFEQIGKRVFLTEAGSEMQRYCRSITQQITEAEEVFDELRGSQRGHLPIATPSTANHLTMYLLAAFLKAHPAVTFATDVTNREGLLRQLEANECDLAIMGQPPANRELVATPFMDNPLVVIAPVDHPLAGARKLPIDALGGETFVVREQGSGTRDAMQRLFDEKGWQLSAGMEMASNEAIKQAVEAGLGLSIVSQHTLAVELAAHRIVMLDVVGFPIIRRWYIVHRKEKRLSAAVSAFQEFVIDEAALHWHLPGLESAR